LINEIRIRPRGANELYSIVVRSLGATSRIGIGRKKTSLEEISEINRLQ